MGRGAGGRVAHDAARARDRQRRLRGLAEPRRPRAGSRHRRPHVLRPLVHRGSVRPLRRRGRTGRGDPHRAVRSGADRNGPPQLAVPARSTGRCLRPDPEPVPRARDGPALAHAGRVGAAPRHLDRVAASRTGLAGQARRRFRGCMRRSSASSRHTSRSRSSVTTRTCGSRRDGARRSRRTAWIACVCTSCRPIASGSATRRRPASSTPTGRVVLANWAFNAWAKYDNYALDAQVGAAMAAHHRPVAGIARAARHRRAAGARRRRHRDRTAPDCCSSPRNGCSRDVQVRNPGLGRADYEAAFADVAGRRPHHLARRGLRRRRHARARRRHRALRRAATRSCWRIEEDPADDNHAAIDRQPAAPGAGGRDPASVPCGS